MAKKGQTSQPSTPQPSGGKPAQSRIPQVLSASPQSLGGNYQFTAKPFAAQPSLYQPQQPLTQGWGITPSQPMTGQAIPQGSGMPGLYAQGGGMQPQYNAQQAKQMSVYNNMNPNGGLTTTPQQTRLTATPDEYAGIAANAPGALNTRVAAMYQRLANEANSGSVHAQNQLTTQKALQANGGNPLGDALRKAARAAGVPGTYIRTGYKL